jgi:subtilisin-like proprotein convertase family protein
MKKLLLIFLYFSIICLCSVVAQTFNGSAGHMADNNSTEFTALVSGLNPSVIDTANFGLEKVCVDIDHTWDDDVMLRLVAPDGQSVMLVNSIGDSENNFTETCFTADASESITSGSPPFTGTFRPMGVLGLVNNGQVGNGTWKLIATDLQAGDDGEVLGWSITFGDDPATYHSLSSSNLPLVIINTNNQNIQDDPKIMADMGIIYNGSGVRNYRTDAFNHYS